MPLGIGRYSDHVKISTECFDDEVETSDKEETIFVVRYIGQQNIPLFNSRDISGIMYYIYNKNYSPLNFLSMKKYELSVDMTGIKVYSSSKKGTFPQNLFMSYSLTDILLVSTDYQHDRLFAIVFYGSLCNCMIHLYLCNNDDDVRNLLNKCSDDFSNSSEIRLVEKSPYSDGIEIIHYKPYEKAKDGDQPLSEQIEGDVRSVDEKKLYAPCERSPSLVVGKIELDYANEKSAKNPVCDFGNFGEFQAASMTVCPDNEVGPIPNSPREGKNEVKRTPSEKPKVSLDDDFEDEFAELALKRNVYVPDHLQDRSIESSLLVQEHASNITLEDSMKPGFFSSYNKLQ